MQRLIHTIKQSLQDQPRPDLYALPLSILAGIFSYYDTYHETQEVQDDLLRQVANYLDPSDADDENTRSTTTTRFPFNFPIRPTPLSACLSRFQTACTPFRPMTTTITTAFIPATPSKAASPSCRKATTAKNWPKWPPCRHPPHAPRPTLIILLTVWITHRAMRSVKTCPTIWNSAKSTTSRRWTW